MEYHDMVLVAHTPQDHHKRRELGVHHCGYIYKVGATAYAKRHNQSVTPLDADYAST